MIPEYRGEVVPAYNEPPTMSHAAGVVIVRFVIALVSTRSAMEMILQLKGRDSEGILGFVCFSFAISLWSVATLFVIACLQNWLGKTYLRLAMKWSIVAGACYPIMSWILANFGTGYFYWFLIELAYSILFPILWGYIAFKSPELPTPAGNKSTTF